MMPNKKSQNAMKTDFRRLIASFAILNGKKEAKGNAGERFAKNWFERMDIEYYPLPQSIGTIPLSLSRLGGKRPDFAVALKDSESLVYIDAKFHQTNNVTEFVLEESEINRFVIFRDWVRDECGDDGDRNIIIMLYPIELKGDRFVWIHIDDLVEGELAEIDGKPARKVSLLGRDGAWYDNVADGA
jgi:hypothetical protein